MWILLLILSIKLNMPTWYWVIFIVVTIFRPFTSMLSSSFMKGFIEGLKKK